MAKNEYKGRIPKKAGLFTYLEKGLPISNVFIDGLPSRYLPVVIYVFLLGLVYVWNTHYYDRTSRTLDVLEKEVEGLRVEYTSIKSSYMVDGKQSVVAHRVAPLGIYESHQPPIKIKLP